jgi:hypothetical protein
LVDVVAKVGRFVSNFATHLTGFCVLGPKVFISVKAPYSGEGSPGAPLTTPDAPLGGVVVHSPTTWFLNRGLMSNRPVMIDAAGGNERFLVDLSSWKITPVTTLDGYPINAWTWDQLPAESPDGTNAIVSGTPQTFPGFPSGWRKYSDTYYSPKVAAAANGEYLMSGVVVEPYLLDLKRATQTLIWDAPLIPYRTKVAWSPSGRTVALADTFLPNPALSDGCGRRGCAIVSVDIKSRKFDRIPLPQNVKQKALAASDFVSDIQAVRWKSESELEITFASGVVAEYRKLPTGWIISSAVNHAAGDAGRTDAKTESDVAIEVREGLNTPPTLHRVNHRSGKDEVIFDPNPEFGKSIELGKVSDIKWQDPSGRTWNANLYLPIDYKKTDRYPVVIQTHWLVLDNSFSLYGSNAMGGSGPGLKGYVAQILAGQGYVTVQMEDKAKEPNFGTPDEPRMYAAAYLSLTKYLVRSGIADQARIGLMGFSRTGWHVEYALTHTDFPYRAAAVIDSFDGSYSAATAQGMLGDDDRALGAAPFGKGLKYWLENSPEFSLDRVRTPLELQAPLGGLTAMSLEFHTLSRLRALHLPVEYYGLPDMDRAPHGPQNPQQIIAANQRVVDWWNFWLKNTEDPSPSKLAQYQYWRLLKSQWLAALKVPRPPLLKWSSTP